VAAANVVVLESALISRREGVTARIAAFLTKPMLGVMEAAGTDLPVEVEVEECAMISKKESASETTVVSHTRRMYNIAVILPPGSATAVRVAATHMTFRQLVVVVVAAAAGEEAVVAAAAAAIFAMIFRRGSAIVPTASSRTMLLRTNPHANLASHANLANARANCVLTSRRAIASGKIAAFLTMKHKQQNDRLDHHNGVTILQEDSVTAEKDAASLMKRAETHRPHVLVAEVAEEEKAVLVAVVVAIVVPVMVLVAVVRASATITKRASVSGRIAVFRMHETSISLE